MATINFDHLNKEVKKEPVLTDINLQIPAQSIISLIKPASESLLLLYGFILGEEKPTSGQVTVNDLMTNKHKKELQKQVIYIMPDAEVGKFKTIGKFVSATLKKGTDSVSQKQALQIMDQFNFTDKMTLDQLDDAQLQQLTIIQAILMQAQVILLEQPTDKMNEHQQKQIWQLLQDYVKKTGAIVLLVSDSVAEMQLFTDKMIYFRHGQIRKIKELPAHDSVDSFVSITGNGFPIETAETLGATILQETETETKLLFAGNIQSLLPLLEQSTITDVRITDATIENEMTGI